MTAPSPYGVHPNALLEIVATKAEASVFRPKAVDDLRPRRTRFVLGFVLGLLAGTAAPLVVLLGRALAPLPATLCMIVILFGVLAGIGLNNTRGHWVMYLSALLSCVPLLFLLEVPTAALIISALAGITFSWLGMRFMVKRDAQWEHFKPLLEKQRFTLATIMEVELKTIGHASAVYDAHLVVSAPQLGHSWHVNETTGPRFYPQKGEEVAVWFYPDNPDVALVLAPTETTGMAAASGITLMPPA